MPSRPRSSARPPDLSAPVLEKAALEYLGRYASSSAQLRQVLMRRVRRAQMLGAGDTATAVTAIDALVQRYIAAGLLDDRRFAEAQAASLQRRGTSQHFIRRRLAAKGIAREFVEEAVADLAENQGAGDLAAACALARRRRLGPYRAPGTRGANRKRDLAALARAGFSLEIARRVLAAKDPEALDRLSRGEEC